MSGQMTTESQYELISGNWDRYFSRLLYHGRKGQLTREDLLLLLEKQKGLCALSGEPLTCILEKGKKCRTNASIDRLEAGGSYAPENVQLVCAVLNGFRIDTPLDEFIEFCHKVSDYQRKKGGHPCHS